MDTEKIKRKPSAAVLPDRKPRRSLKQVIQDLFSPVKRTIDGVETDFSGGSCMKKTLISMLKLRVWILVPLAVIVCAAALYFLYQSGNTATAEISLNYEEAANGLNPNSTRFNSYNIASTEVVKNTLRYCGIDPETADVDGLCNAITVSSTNNKAFSEDDFYISTTFKVKLKKPRSIKGVRTEDLLKFLCKAYKDDFYSKYTENRATLAFDIDVFNDKEYLEIADLLDLKAQLIRKYLSTRVKQNKAFIESESNETFKSLLQKAEDIRDYDISKYRIFVIAAGCSDDKARFLTSLAYVNHLKEISYDKDMAAYTVHNEGIKMYDDAMISVVMIPSIDEAKRSYYMSKTKTGMDYIASRADNYLATAQETAKEITVNQDTMAKMSAGTNTRGNLQKANQMLLDIRGKLSDLSDQVETVDKAYIKYKTKDYLTFKMVKQSTIHSMRPSRLFVLGAGLLAMAYALIWLRFRYFKSGEEKA